MQSNGLRFRFMTKDCHYVFLLGVLDMKRLSLMTAVAAMAATVVATDAVAADKVGLGAGDFLVRARGIAVVPDVSSDVDTIGGDVDIKNDYVPEIDFSYFVTDNIAFELIAATTRHSVKDKNSLAGDVDLGKVSLLPPTLTAQWHFLPRQSINPYVGAGINYTIFYDEKSGDVSSISYDNTFGWALQAGVDISVGDGWFINADVKKLFINTDVTVDAGGTQVKADVDIDPWIFGLGVGYRF